MPDMKQPGAHIEAMYQSWILRADNCRKDAVKLTIEAEALDTCIREWDKALEKEEEKK